MMAAADIELLRSAGTLLALEARSAHGNERKVEHQSTEEHAQVKRNAMGVAFPIGFAYLVFEALWSPTR